MNPKNTRRSAFAFALTLALGVPFHAAAQNNPSPTSAEGSKDEVEVVVLSPFVVDSGTDLGYTAVESLAGGRTNTAVKFTPASMSSLTRTFIDDVGAQNVRDVLKWTPNVVPSDLNAGKGFGGSAFHDWSFNFRGAGAGQQGGPGPTRNYFSFYQAADSYNIDRVEFDRGPNSILFGLGTVGGVLSTYTKIPQLGRSFAKTTAIFDSNESLRFELDVNQPLNDQVAIRVNAVFDNNRGWRKNDENDRRAVDLAVLYRPTANTLLRIEGEASKLKRTLISTTIGDKASGWDGITESPTWGAAPVGAARTIPIQNAGAWGDWLNPFPVYIPTLGEKSLLGWAGGHASTGSLLDVGQALNFQPREGWYPDQIKLPWETAFSSTAAIPLLPSRDWTYGHGISDTDYKNITVILDHTFNENWAASLSYYRYYDDQSAKDYEGTGGAAIDINRQLPDGSANPNFGKPFADFFLSRQTQSRTNTEMRAQVNYKFDATLFNAPWRQVFTVATSKKDLTIAARQSLGQFDTPIANPADWVQNLIWGRIYLDQPNQLMKIPETAPDGRAIAYLPKADGYWFDFDDSFKLTDVAFSSHSLLFNDKLSILLGARRDRYKETVRSLRRGPNLTDTVSDESESGQTFSAGLVYYFNWLGVFANYSENLQPPNAGSQPLLSGERPGPEKGKGVDFGLRVATGDGRYYATLTRYDTESEGRLVENPIALRGIWQRYNEALGNPTDSGNGGLAFSDTTSLDVSGYEFEVTGNPTKNLRLQASIGKPDARIVNYYPDSRAYFAANLPTWTPVAAGTSPDAVDVRSAIATVQNALDQAVPGARQTGLVKYTASIFANYSFLEGPLQGFSMGAGVARRGRTYAAIHEGETYYGAAITDTSAVFAYQTKISDRPVRIALNVENVLGKRDPIVTSYHWGYTDASGRHINDGYFLQAPRTYRLSIAYSF